jgi:hypothetical protein
MCIHEHAWLKKPIRIKKWGGHLVLFVLVWFFGLLDFCSLIIQIEEVEREIETKPNKRKQPGLVFSMVFLPNTWSSMNVLH